MRLADLGVLVAAVWWSLSGAAAARTGTNGEVARFDRVDVPGLTHGSITAIAQDADGFLWIGTRDGLNRWDGYEVLSFGHEPQNPGSLSGHFVTSLLADRGGRLWVGTEDGLNRYEPVGHGFVRYALASGTDPPDGRTPTVRSIHEGADGTLWLGTSHGLFVHDARQDVFIPVGRGPDVFAPETPTAMCIRSHPDGTLWVLATGYPRDASAARLYRVQPDGPDGAVRLDEFEMEQRDLAPYAFFIDSQGRFWTGAAVPSRPDLPSRRLVGLGQADEVLEAASAFVEDSLGRVWIGTTEGLFVAPSGSDAAVRASLPETANWLGSYVGSMLEDAAGTLWVGTNAGLLRADPAAKAFRHVGKASPESRAHGLTIGAVASMAFDPDGDLWVGTWGAGLDRIDRTTGAVRNYRASSEPSSPLPEAAAVFVLADSRGRLWAAANEHLCRYVPAADSFRCHTIPEGDGTRRWIWSLAEGPSGRLFAGTNYSGVFEFLSERGEFVPLPGDKEMRRAMGPGAFALAAQPDGVLWVGGFQGLLTRLDLVSGHATSIVLRDRHGRQGGAIHDLLIDAGGRLWAGANAGLFVLPPGGGPARHYGQADGLPGSYVYGLLEDRGGRIWISTNRGLVRCDTRRPDGAPEFRIYDVEDGIGSLEFNRHARLRTSDGRLFFGGMSGVTWFDPDAIVDNPRVPPVVVTGVRITDRDGRERPVDASGGVTFGPSDHSISFAFAALSYTAPRKNQYRYRLEGFEEGWVEAGDRRFARYTNIPNGEYVFRVQGSNNDGVWNEAGLALPLVAVPALWETWWFRLALVALLVALLAMAYRLRVNQLLQVERMRTRIAGDLHDDLSSDLSGIALAMDLLERRHGLDDADRRRIAQVRTTARSMVDGVRDIVWYVNPEHDSLEALARRMKAVSSTLLADREVDMAIDLPHPSASIDMGFRRHVFLVFKELLHNIARHSRASRVWIRLHGAGNRLALQVRDDGVGFDPAVATAGEGLASLRRRAVDLGATLQIESAAGSGTRVVFDAPLRGAPRARET